MKQIVNATNLTGGYKGKTVWRNASFDIKPGEFVGLLGPNGAGKTTLFRMLLGLIKPLGGELDILGHKPKKGNPRIGYIPQRRLADTESKLLAFEYVKMSIYGTSYGFSGPNKYKKEIELATEALKRVDALDLASKPLSQLSGGEMQRIFLAQALASKPDLLLLDEPLSNLDMRRTNQLISLVHKIAKQDDIGVILIAHDINPLLPYIDRVIYIANERVATGRLDEVITGNTLSKLYNAPIEVLKDSKGRLAVLGTEDVTHHE
jgi:zinc/manganese transport system ATP-binding protein